MSASKSESKYLVSTDTVDYRAWSFSFAAMHFSYYDHLFLIRGNQKFQETARSIVENHWELQKLEVNQEGRTTTFKLKGAPFNAESLSFGRNPSGPAKLMMCEIVKQLLCVGWRLTATTNLARMDNKRTMFFERVSDNEKPSFSISESMIFLSPSGGSSMHIGHLPADGRLHSSLLNVMNTYGPPIEVKRVSSEGPNLSLIEFKGNMWSTTGESKIAASQLIVQLIQHLEINGFQLYGTSNVKGAADTLYFVPSTTNHHSDMEYITVTLDATDSLRIFNAKVDTIEDIRNKVIGLHWHQGISEEGPHHGGYQWKLKGKPWWCSGEEAVNARILVLAIFRTMTQKRFDHYATLDLTRKHSGKSVIIFRGHSKARQSDELQNTAFACIGLSATDKIRIIGFPNAQNISRQLQSIVTANWESGVQEVTDQPGNIEIKIKGNPWCIAGISTWAKECEARKLSLEIFKYLVKDEGWTFVSPVKLSGQYMATADSGSYPLNLDSWIFRRTSTGSNSSCDLPPSYDDAVGQGAAKHM